MKKTDIIIEIYEYLKSIDLAANECEFSEHWLGCSSSYFRSLRFRNRDPSIGALGILSTRLNLIGGQMLATKTWRQMGLKVISYAEQCAAEVNVGSLELEI
jgi:hypothetical protein